MPVTFVPHLVPLDRGILETIYARLKPGVDEAAVGAALHAAYADVAVRAADRRRSAGDQARRAHQLLRHRLARRAPRRAARHGVVHRQPGEGRGRPGDPELQRRVRLRRNARRSTDDMTTVLKLGGELLETRRRCGAAAAAIVRLAGDDAAGGRARRRARHRRRAARARQHAARSSTACASPTRRRSTPWSSVLAGRTNTPLVAALGAAGGRAVGLTGADGRIGLSSRAAAFTSVDGRVGRSRARRSAGRHRRVAADRPAAASATSR